MKVASAFASAIILVSLTQAVAARPDDPPAHPTPHEQPTPGEHPTPPDHPTPPAHPTRPTPVDCASVSGQIEGAMSQCSCDAQNHGRYVSCVAQALNHLDIPRQCRRTMASCAGHSTCGRTGAVTCQRSKPGACATASGTCIRGTSATGTCTSNADCVATKCTIMSSADRCTAAGGSPGSGSCCAPAPLAPAPAPTPTATPGS
jgi:hypothetical protein